MLEIIESETIACKGIGTRLGTHTLVEFIACDATALSLVSTLEPIILEAVSRSGATYVSHHLKQFDPIGASGVVLIAESHVSFHTWPEHGYMAFDIFTCSEQMDADAAIEYIAEHVGADSVKQRVLDRGF